MRTSENKKFSNPVAIEIDHIAEDLLDAASEIDRLTSKFSQDLQAILQRQADSIKAYAEVCERDQISKH